MKKIFTQLITIILILLSYNSFSIPKLNSYPSAIATIFIDFDGHYVQSTVWNNGNPINCAASGLTDAQIIEAFNRSAEDFRPFNVNLTTDSTVFLATPLNRRIRIIVTATSSWAIAGIGGVAYIGTFSWGDDTPAFVFSDRHGYSPKKVGETISHETGHTLGLAHQSKYGGDCYTPIEQYNSGFGTGETAWSPIMGNSLSRNFSNWNNGPTPYGCTDVQDNLTIITTQNGFGYRTDDYPETLNTNTYSLQGTVFNVDGVISTNIDKDAFKFTLNANSNFNLTAVPFNVSANWIGANLDTRIELYNSSFGLIRDYNPLSSLSVSIDTVLNAGTYYIKIYGTGNSNIGAYGSLGSYTITGSFSGLPIHDVRLSGNVDKGKHNLNWKIIADEPIKTIEVQTSNDGTNFTRLEDVAANASKFSYLPYKNSTVFYRLKVTSVLDQTVFSNTLALKAEGTDQRLFRVSTLVTNEITINADLNYQYRICDMNGATINKGTGLKGTNRVNASNLSRGMYIIQFFNDIQNQTERIIRQ
ncbi:MAG: T9SS type A sorting domain-containing protein [Chitinophagaceae bacterium]|nr:T9SS type A sorting domain-containing protein [Chitinophagaceae bacterium]